MNVIIEMIKMAAVVKGGLTNEAAEAIGGNLEAVIEKVDAALNASIVANETASVRNLLDSARLATELKEIELAAALLEQAGEMVMDDDDGDEEEVSLGAPAPDDGKQNTA